MKKILAVLSVLSALCVSEWASGGTWYVDCSVSASGNGTSWAAAFKIIQEGLNAASSGDTVMVDAGLYYENVYFNGKSVALLGSGAVSTIVDGGGTDSVITFWGSETALCVISGFTIRGGQDFYGGGILCGNLGKHSTASIENNIIVSNSCLDCGGGVAFCDGIIQNNTVSQNLASGDGGGLYECGGTIQNNNISNNSAMNGGGLYGCGGPIVGNTVSDNSAGNDGGGFYQCVGPFENNTRLD